MFRFYPHYAIAIFKLRRQFYIDPSEPNVRKTSDTTSRQVGECVIGNPGGWKSDEKQQCKQQPRYLFHRMLPQWLDNFISENEIIYCMRAYLSNRLETKAH